MGRLGNKLSKEGIKCEEIIVYGGRDRDVLAHCRGEGVLHTHIITLSTIMAGVILSSTPIRHPQHRREALSDICHMIERDYATASTLCWGRMKT